MIDDVDDTVDIVARERCSALIDKMVRTIQYVAPKAQARYSETPTLDRWSHRELLCLAGSFEGPIPPDILERLEKAPYESPRDRTVQTAMNKFGRMALERARLGSSAHVWLILACRGRHRRSKKQRLPRRLLNAYALSEGARVGRVARRAPSPPRRLRRRYRLA
jgi:hypothetical protein